MFEIESENYDNVKSALKDLLQELKTINEITINGKTYKIKFVFGGDLKFISIVFGLQAANSNHPCPWCHIDISKPVNIFENWTISRSHELSKAYTSENK